MGSYINPPDMTKEEWLEKNAEEWNPLVPPTDEEMVVCLIDNGPFTAAGIMFNAKELAEFRDPADARPKRWFKAKISDLVQVSDLENYVRYWRGECQDKWQG